MRSPLCRRAAQHHVLDHRHARERARNLKGPREPKLEPRMSGCTFDSDAVQQDGARGWTLLAGQHVEKCRLACAVRTDKPKNASPGNFDRDAVDGRDAAKAFDDFARR